VKYGTASRREGSAGSEVEGREGLDSPNRVGTLRRYILGDGWDQGPVLEKDPMVRAATLTNAGERKSVSGPISTAPYLDPAVSKTRRGNVSRPMTGATGPARLRSLTRAKLQATRRKRLSGASIKLSPSLNVVAQQPACLECSHCTSTYMVKEKRAAQSIVPSPPSWADPCQKQIAGRASRPSRCLGAVGFLRGVNHLPPPRLHDHTPARTIS
jgi:hypothetical protein